MDTKKLRQKILDLAIRGKLVPQDPNDEPASVLLERIRAEKEKLIKEGKIKRSKKSASASDTPHYENDAPFEVPESWEWCKLSDIASFGGGKTPSMDNKQYWSNGNNLWITSKDMKSERIADSMMKISDEALTFMTQYESGTLLMVTRSGILRHTLPVAILEKKATVNQDLKVISLYTKEIHKYIFFAIKAREEFILKEYHKDGTTVDSINFEKFSDILLPMPPYDEQQRIVSTIEQWFTLIDTLENAKDDLQTAIAQAKSKILDLAIHGKLVPQDPSDEPAIELLKRINSKFTPCDNAHYENLPNGWCAMQLGDLCTTINGLWKGKKEPFVNVGVIRNANFTKDFKLDYSNIAYLDVEKKQYEKRKLKVGDIVVEKSGGSDSQPVGRTVLFTKTEGEFSFSNFTSVLRIIDGYPVLPDYINCFLHSLYLKGITKEMQTQTIGIHNLIFDQFLSIQILLPPLTEQERIVSEINRYNELLDKISAEL